MCVCVCVSEEASKGRSGRIAQTRTESLISSHFLPLDSRRQALARGIPACLCATGKEGRAAQETRAAGGKEARKKQLLGPYRPHRELYLIVGCYPDCGVVLVFGVLLLLGPLDATGGTLDRRRTISRRLAAGRGRTAGWEAECGYRSSWKTRRSAVGDKIWGWRCAGCDGRGQDGTGRFDDGSGCDFAKTARGGLRSMTQGQPGWI